MLINILFITDVNNEKSVFSKPAERQRRKAKGLIQEV